MRAASTALSTSSSAISPFALATATTPLLACDSICVPEIPTQACSIGKPTSRSTFSRALDIDDTHSSILETTPLPTPSDGTSTAPIICKSFLCHCEG